MDDYSRYKALITAGPVELAGLAHIRHKFFHLHAAAGSPVVEEALRSIGQLYAIEQLATGITPKQRLALHEQHATRWLFAGAKPAGRRAPPVKSLVAIAELNGFDPANCMADTLKNF